MRLKGMKLISLISCLFSTSMATAGNMGTQAPITDKTGEFSLSVGYYNADGGKRQHINIVDLVGNTYTVRKKNDESYLVGLGYLVNGWNFNRANLGFGIKAFLLGNTHVKGVIEQEDVFTNLSYKYDLMHIPVYAMGRGLINFGSNSALTLDAGIGPNFVTTVRYDERSLDGGVTIPDYSFNGHTRTTFSATAGVGIKFQNLIKSAGIEIGYRFFYLGQGNLKPRSNQILNHLRTNDIYANSVVLTISI